MSAAGSSTTTERDWVPKRVSAHFEEAADVLGAILLEQNDEWSVQRDRYMTLETIAPMRDDFILMLPAAAA